MSTRKSKIFYFSRLLLKQGWM